MAINRNPKKNFTRMPNRLVEKVPLNMIGIIYFFLSKPTGWKMRLDDLLHHWTASGQSLRRYLKELRKNGYIEIKPFYDNTKNRLAGSFYRLIELSEEDTTFKRLEENIKL